MNHPILDAVDAILPMKITGVVSGVVGLSIQSEHFPVPLGSFCRIHRQAGLPLDTEVVGFRDDQTLMVAYGDVRGVRRGDIVEFVSTSPHIRVGPALLGRVVDGMGNYCDGKPTTSRPHQISLYQKPPNPMARPKIADSLETGIRAIDAFLTCAKGQRLGIFAGTGVGKSVTLGMIARFAKADVIVVGLVGERGREVREFLENDLGEEGLKRCVVVVATGDEPALLRKRAAFTATAISEYFRDRGQNVLLLMDSLTRLAMAQREIGLAAGEPPTTKGYPPSVFAMMPALLERTGLSDTGSITAFYSVLVESDDINEIVSDTVRGVLDGHFWLSRQLAAKSHYPAIDILESISRSMPDVVTPEHLESAMELKQILATYRENEDLISVGAYQAGSSPAIDQAIAMREILNHFLRQNMSDFTTFEQSLELLNAIRHQAIRLAQAKTVNNQQTSAQNLQPNMQNNAQNSPSNVR